MLEMKYRIFLSLLSAKEAQAEKNAYSSPYDTTQKSAFANPEEKRFTLIANVMSLLPMNAAQYCTNNAVIEIPMMSHHNPVFMNPASGRRGSVYRFPCFRCVN